MELVKQLRKDFSGYYLGVEQVFVVNFAKMPIVLTVDRVLGGEEGLVFVGSETVIETFASG